MDILQDIFKDLNSPPKQKKFIETQKKKIMVIDPVGLQPIIGTKSPESKGHFEKINKETSDTSLKELVKHFVGPCPEGKIMNPKTGRCNKMTKDKTDVIIGPCPEGKIMNPKTGRCNKMTKDKTDVIIGPCPEGKIMNPKTGRCNKIKISAAGQARKLTKQIEVINEKKQKKKASPKPKVKDPQKERLKKMLHKVKPCPPGKVRNIKTGRCINIK